MTDEELDHSPMSKGKYGPYKGNPKTPNEVADTDPNYIVWAYETWGPGECCSKVLYEACEQEMNEAARQRYVSKDQRGIK